MNKIIKYLLSILFFTHVSCQEKKDNKTTKAMTKFEWRETISCPPGYPVDVYRGGLQSADGDFTSLYLGTHSGNKGWGSSGRSMSNGMKSIPNHLHVIWVSYAEKTFYEVDAAIDYDKMYKLFREGFYTPSDGDDPRPRKENYNQIIVGFAPGGVVVVWISGVGRQVEIGRYQGKEIVIPQKEIDGLSPGPHKNMFDSSYQHKILYEFGVVSKEIVKANEGIPIPFGLWDNYREKHNWKLDIEMPDKGKTKEVFYFYYNGEFERTFGESQIETYSNIISNDSKWDISKIRAIPNDIKFLWLNGIDGYRYVSNIKFNEQEIISAFKELSKDNTEANIILEVRVNTPKTAAAVKLTNGTNDVWLKNSEIMIRKTKYTY